MGRPARSGEQQDLDGNAAPVEHVFVVTETTKRIDDSATEHTHKRKKRHRVKAATWREALAQLAETYPIEGDGAELTIKVET